MLEFKAMLCLAVAEAHSDMVKTAYNLPRIKDSTDSIAYISHSDEVVKRHTKRFWHLLYLTITSYDFVDRFTFIKNIINLQCSEFDKLVILLNISGFSSKEAAFILASEPGSISSICNRRKDEIKKIKPVILRQQA